MDQDVKSIEYFSLGNWSLGCSFVVEYTEQFLFSRYSFTDYINKGFKSHQILMSYAPLP
jgi:hypothetical protein